MKKCKYCGSQNEDDNLFCTECGKELPKGMVCPNCGTFLDVGHTFCSNCGKKIEEQVVPDDSLSLLRKCTYCGAVLDEDDMYCSSCGKKVEEQSEPDVIQVLQRRCSKCGTVLDEDDMYCSNCGQNPKENPLSTSNLSNENAGNKSGFKNSEDLPKPNSDTKESTISHNSGCALIIEEEGEGKSDDNIAEKEVKTTSSRRFVFTILDIILLAVLGYGCWYIILCIHLIK